MDPLYLLQPISAHTDHSDGLSPLERYSWPPAPVLDSGPELYTQPSDALSHYAKPYFQASDISSHTAPSGYLQASDFSSQSYYSAPYLRLGPSDISSQPYYSADSSLSYPATKSAPTWSSNMSFPYSVTSITSRKSRKNVLYPRRAHPLPVLAPSEHFSISHDALIWQIQLLSITLLPHAETRLIPAGRVLIQSLGLHGDIPQPVPGPIDEETRYCSELFIALAREVLLKDATGAGELEGPCKLLYATFKYIISPLGSLSFPKIPKSNETGLQATASGAELQWLSEVLLALISAFNAFEGALNTIKIKPAISKNGAVQDHHMTLPESSESTGLTMKQYRKKLDQNLAQTREQLNRLGLSEGVHLSAMSLISLYEYKPQPISTIEECPETEGEGSSMNCQSHSDSGKRNWPRRIWRRLMPPSIGRKKERA